MSSTPTLDRFSRPGERRAALDRAHLGDIRGGAGTIGALDTAPRRSRRRQIATLLAIAGPGLIVMAADNDAGSITVFAQTGRSYGVGLVWVLVLLAPVLYVGQEMAARLGAVTGVGHARLIRERFGAMWCAFSLGDLVVLNFALLVTEFIGVGVALSVLGIPRLIAVPIAALALVACTASGSFPAWERVMAVFIAGALIVIALAVIHHPPAHALATGLAPRTGTAAGPIGLLLLALVGTSICPWQIFFQQSNVIDKRITPRWLRYERLDIAAGTGLFIAGAAAVMVLCATLVDGRHHLLLLGAGAIARALAARAGSGVAAGFAVALLSASLLGAVAVSLSTSYAISEVRGYRHSLHRPARRARAFHGLHALQILLAAGVVLIPGLPLGAVTTLAQALAGLLSPSALALLFMLCNDRAVLGPRVNGRRRNAIAGIALAAVLELSMLFTVSTVAPGFGLAPALALSGTLLLAAAAGLGLVARLQARRARARRPPTPDPLTPWDALTWTAPALERMPAAPASCTRRLALGLLRIYTVVTVALLLAHLGSLALGR